MGSLAMAEMFFVVGFLIRRFEMELYKTPRAKIERGRDYGVLYPRHGKLSVRALVTKLLDEEGD